jgi:endonuclease/exonuclease/phosphatase family metal-dependent hydrolase
MKRPPLKIFYSYAHEDANARDRLDEHLELLARRNLIVRWHDRHIVPGQEWNEAITTALGDADIILLLVSKAFMESDYVRTHEIPCAMREHDAGRARVLPILLQDVKGWRKAPFAKLEVLPDKGHAVSAWNDPVAAYASIAKGIEKVAKDIIVAGGGPFEFGAHTFTEAELSSLSKGARKRTLAALERTRHALEQQIPPRRYERNLLMANWSLRKFGAMRAKDLLPESLYVMAQIISAFDLVALQEVDRNLDQLERLLEILGPDWSYLATEVAPGAAGNNERFALLYYEPRVTFGNISSNLIMPEDRAQLARPPLLSAFRSGDWELEVCTTHIYFGGQRADHHERRLTEIHELLKHLQRRAKEQSVDLFLLGDFQITERDSAVHRALVDGGVQIPEMLLEPASALTNRFYSLIGYLNVERDIPLAGDGRSGGVFRTYDYAMRDEDLGVYSKTAAYRNSRFVQAVSERGAADRQERLRQFARWRTYHLSDHLPLWIELDLPAE